MPRARPRVGVMAIPRTLRASSWAHTSMTTLASSPARKSELMGGKLVSNRTCTILPRTDTMVPILAGAVESSMRIVGQASTVARLLIPGSLYLCGTVQRATSVRVYARQRTDDFPRRRYRLVAWSWRVEMDTPRQVGLRIRNLRRQNPIGDPSRSKFEPNLQ